MWQRAGYIRINATLRRFQVAWTVLSAGCLVAGCPVVPLLQVPNRLRLTEPKGISHWGRTRP